jgi:2'-5' RNA ligase
MQPAPRHRVFFAVWPNEGVRAALAASILGLGRHASGSWVRPENFHITLRFIGAVFPAQLDRLCRLPELEARVFTLRLTQLRYQRRRQLLWMEPRVVPREWIGLEAGLSAALGSSSEIDDARPAAPHVTLGRKVEVTALLPPAVSPIDWPVESVLLLESTLRPSGSEYSVLRRWHLRTTPAGSNMK